jgi:Protein of unknown function (DUF3302)
MLEPTGTRPTNNNVDKAMDFTLQGFGPFLHWLTLGILIVMPILLAYVIYTLGNLPGKIARSRGHPQAAAVGICGWMGIITLVLWPLAMVWAYWSYDTGSRDGALTQSDANRLLDSVRAASQRIAAIEAKLPAKSGA